jgi:hypothetical protein
MKIYPSQYRGTFSIFSYGSKNIFIFIDIYHDMSGFLHTKGYVIPEAAKNIVIPEMTDIGVSKACTPTIKNRRDCSRLSGISKSLCDKHNTQFDYEQIRQNCAYKHSKSTYSGNMRPHPKDTIPGCVEEKYRNDQYAILNKLNLPASEKARRRNTINIEAVNMGNKAVCIKTESKIFY